MLKNIENVDQVIQLSFDLLKINPYWNFQIQTKDSKYNRKFLEYLKTLSEYTYVDGLGGVNSTWQRVKANKSFEEVIQFSESDSKCGIKIVHLPIGKCSPWEEWSDGYLEGFIRMVGDSDFNEYFIWMYIKQDHLKDILEKFKNELCYYGN